MSEENSKAPESASDPDAERWSRLTSACVVGVIALVACVAYQKAYNMMNPAPAAGQQVADSAWVHTTLAALDRQQASQPAPSPGWHYQPGNGPDGQRQARLAIVESRNAASFHAPGSQPRHAALIVRQAAGGRPDVVLAIRQGAFQCILEHCSVRVRFGEGKASVVRATRPEDRNATVLHLQHPQEFLQAMQASASLSIEAVISREKNQTFTFDVAGFRAQ